jgi:hypothetical protein
MGYPRAAGKQAGAPLQTRSLTASVLHSPSGTGVLPDALWSAATVPLDSGLPARDKSA